MRVAVFSTKAYDRTYLAPAAESAGMDFRFFEPRLTADTAPLAGGFPGICAFVNDELRAATLERVAAGGTRLIALRCAGFNNTDLEAAARLGIKVARVPAYSPYAVAEHTIGLILSLNRKFHRAFNRVRDGNFSIDGLLGFDLHGKTAGVIGTGRIGALVAKSLACFGCELLLHDVQKNPELDSLGRYVSHDELFADSDIISLHCPLAPQTHHLVCDAAIDRMKPGVMIINTSRGALVDTLALIRGLKSGKVGYVGLDVYEEEADLFFEDLSDRVITDDTFMRLLTFPNVLITAHQAFFTKNALEEIARVTISNIRQFERGEPLTNEVTTQQVKK
jgi:D-lactate dehydrogenase